MTIKELISGYEEEIVRLKAMIKFSHSNKLQVDHTEIRLDTICEVLSKIDNLNVEDLKRDEKLVCPKCGCNKITGDGSKSWCLNSECDFIQAD